MMRALVAEKSKEIRQRIVEALMRVDEISVQGAVSDVRAAVYALAAASPELVVTGIELSDGTGLDVIEAAQQITPRARIVVVGPAPTPESWRAYLAAGAHRFVEPDAGLVELREVVAGLVTSATRSSGEDELRLLGRMAAGVVHDLGNYLGVVEAALAWLERSPEEPESLARARNGVDRANELLETLLGYVRGVEPKPEPIDFGALVQRMIVLLEASLPVSVAVRVEIADGLSPVFGVRAELEQLVLNLVLNAADAMEEGGDVSIRVLATGHAALCFEVSDSGTGIAAPEAHSHPSAKHGRHAGLGLGIAHRVVARHRGAITISPRRERCGTIATIFLPVHDTRRA